MLFKSKRIVMVVFMVAALFTIFSTSAFASSQHPNTCLWTNIVGKIGSASGETLYLNKQIDQCGHERADVYKNGIPTNLYVALYDYNGNFRTSTSAYTTDATTNVVSQDYGYACASSSTVPLFCTGSA